MMIEGTQALLLRIFIGESDRYNGKPMYNHIVELAKSEGIAGATVLRGINGFGKTSVIHNSSILRLSTDLPIVVEVVDEVDKIEDFKKKLDGVIKGGMVTQEKVTIIRYSGPSDD